MQVQGAEVTVYRIKDPVRPDESEDFDEGVLEAPIVSKQARSLVPTVTDRVHC